MTNVRSRIALWFVGLSTIVYITPTILGIFLFWYSMTGALDLELKTLASSMGHAVALDNGQPHFRDWARIVETIPERSLATIQLYDPHGRLLERSGAKGVPRLMLNTKEVHEGSIHMRITTTPLFVDSNVVGYLQFEVPTKERDSATRQYAWTMALMAPIVLMGLGVCSYYVSDKATIPIRQTLANFKQFIADAGHELNTPLSIIHASTESLQRKLHKQGASVKETEVISNSAERMQKIIDDLSLLAEFESPDRSGLKGAVTDIRDVIEQEVTDFAVKFEQKGVKLSCSETPDCFVPVNKESLHVLFSNLLENALRYTDPGGSVTLDACRDNGQLRVSVCDTGIGIPAENLPFIFDRFYRVDKSRSRASGGSGLGLAIARAIAQSHHGSIEVQSSLGKGSKFTVTLPSGTPSNINVNA